MDEKMKYLDELIDILDKVCIILGEPLEEFSRREKNIIAAYIYGIFIKKCKPDEEEIWPEFIKFLDEKFGYKKEDEESMGFLTSDIQEACAYDFQAAAIDGFPEHIAKANYYLAKKEMADATYEDFIEFNEIKLYDYLAYRMDTLLNKDYKVWNSRAGAYKLRKIFSEYNVW